MGFDSSTVPPVFLDIISVDGRLAEVNLAVSNVGNDPVVSELIAGLDMASTSGNEEDAVQKLAKVSFHVPKDQFSTYNCIHLDITLRTHTIDTQSMSWI